MGLLDCLSSTMHDENDRPKETQYPYVIAGEHSSIPGIYYRVRIDSEFPKGYGQMLFTDKGMVPEDVVKALDLQEDDIVAKIGTFYPYGSSKLRSMGSGTALLERMFKDALNAGSKKIFCRTQSREMEAFLSKHCFSSYEGFFYKSL